MSSNGYADRMARLAVQHSADPATIAAAQKEHERQQKERAAWHRKRGQRMIEIRQEVASGSLAAVEERVGNLRLEHKAIREGLAKGTLTAKEAAQRWEAAVSARERIPAEMDQAIDDLESTSDLDPIEESGRLLDRFPALASRIGGAIPPLPERNGHSDGDGS